MDMVADGSPAYNVVCGNDLLNVCDIGIPGSFVKRNECMGEFPAVSIIRIIVKKLHVSHLALAGAE
jgi:hypothetical protein